MNSQELKQRVVNMYAEIGNEVANIKLKQDFIRDMTAKVIALDKEFAAALQAEAAAAAAPAADPNEQPSK